MSKPKKTVTVLELVARANAALKATPDSWDRERDAIAFYVTCILEDTNNYRGYSYLPTELDATGRLLESFDATRRIYHYQEA